VSIREAEKRIAGCERCREDDAEIPLDWILADVLYKPAPMSSRDASFHRYPSQIQFLRTLGLIKTEIGNEKHLTSPERSLPRR
jgi:hypothetical protein